MKVSIGLGVVLVLAAAGTAAAQPRITRVSSPSVRLITDGRVVSISIDGEDLAKVTAVRFLQNGRIIEGLAGVLQSAQARLPGRTAGRITVDLTASAAVPAGTYELELIAGRDRVLVPIEVAVEDFRRGLTSRLPAVTSGPEVLELVAGGSSATVVVEGRNLDQVRSAYVESSSGSRDGNVEADVQPTDDPGRLAVSLQATPEAGPNWQNPLALVLDTGSRTASGARLETQVRVQVLAALDPGHAVFRTAIDAMLGGGRSGLNSCGPSDSARRLAIELPRVDYRALVPVPRFAQAIVLPELRIAFLEDHTLDPSDPVTGELNAEDLASSAHPSPVPHSVAAVRMCVDTVEGFSWTFKRGTQTGSAPVAVVAVEVGNILFRGRGMPADPSGTFWASAVGMGWGHDITDKEIPDRLYENVGYDVSLTLFETNGRIEYGPVQVARRGGSPQWTGTFFGPASVRQQMESFADGVMRGVDQQIRRVFEASQTRQRISAAIMTQLQAAGATQVLRVEAGSDGQLRFIVR